MKLACLAALLASAAAHACPGLEAEDAWIREAPSGAMMTAGYARLVNKGARTLTVDGASSPAFDSVELHHTVVEGGMSKMRPGRGLTLAPGERGALAPGGWHLMLMNPARALKAGDRVPLSLRCGHESTPFTFTVRAVAE